MAAHGRDGAAEVVQSTPPTIDTSSVERSNSAAVRADGPASPASPTSPNGVRPATSSSSTSDGRLSMEMRQKIQAARDRVKQAEREDHGLPEMNEVESGVATPIVKKPSSDSFEKDPTVEKMYNEYFPNKSTAQNSTSASTDKTALEDSSKPKDLFWGGPVADNTCGDHTTAKQDETKGGKVPKDYVWGGPVMEKTCGEYASKEATAGNGSDPAISKELAVEQPPGLGESSSSSTLDRPPGPPGPPENPQEKQTPPEDQRSKGKTALIMFGLCMATFLAALDMTIITTALPTIAAAFDASSADYTWIGSSYLLAAAASTPTWGKISDIFGRKPTILVCNIIFLIGSLICALSININMLLAGRVVQGIGGGGLLTMTQVCISDLFSLRTRGMYFGIIGLTWALASALGPILGGVFTQLVTWRWCFYVNLPCDGAAFIALMFFLDIQTPKTPFIAGIKAIDWLGSLAIVGGVVMFLFGLEFGGITFPWNSATTVCLIVFGVFTIGVFFVIEKFIPKYPIIPIRIFKSRNNIAALLTCFCHSFVFISGSYFLPLYFQSVLGATPLLSGVYSIPYAISLSLVSAATGVIIKKTGNYRYPIWVGLVFMTLGYGLYIDMMRPYASWARIIVYQIIAGAGAGTNFQSPLIALQNGISPRDIASATATFGFTRQMGTSISVTIGGVIFQNQLAKYAAESTLPPSVQEMVGGSSAGASTAIISRLPAAEHEAAITSYSLGLRDMFIFYCAFAFLGLLISLNIKQKDLSKQHEVTKTGLDVQEKYRQEQLEAKRAKKAARLSRDEKVSSKETV